MILETILNGNNNKVIMLTKEKKIKPPLEFSGSYKNRIYEMGDFTSMSDVASQSKTMITIMKQMVNMLNTPDLMSI